MTKEPNMKKIVFIICILLLYGCTNEEGEVPQVLGMDWVESFEKNAEMEGLYARTERLPEYGIVCIPVKKFICNLGTCEENRPNVFTFINDDAVPPTISRCDAQGCDTYEAEVMVSGNYKNIQSTEPRGFFLKMSYDTIDSKYLEIATIGLETFMTYGYCDFK